MFFLLSKLFWIVFAPANFLLLALAGGAIFAPHRWAVRLLRGLVVLLFLIAMLPVGKWMLVPLENYHPQVTSLPDHVDGIIVLGGATDQQVSTARQIVALREAGERLTEFVRLSKLYPEARKVFTGGAARLVPIDESEAVTAARFFKDMGLNIDEIIFEYQSRNTFQNAAYSKKIAQPRAGEVWLLITSASHMPRSVAVFNKMGWQVVPYPVDYWTDGKYNTNLADIVDFNLLQGLHLLNKASREWIGVVAYALLNKADFKERE